jgi:transposase
MHSRRRPAIYMIRSYLTTTTAHGRNLLEALTELAACNPWLPSAKPIT